MVERQKLREIWDYIQTLEEQDFLPFKALAAESHFGDLAAHLCGAMPNAADSVHKDLARLGVPFSTKEALDYPETHMAVAAITHRIVKRRGH